VKLLSFLFAVVVLVGCASRPTEYLVSHIMCSTEQAADQALGRIRAGESFEQVARGVSVDPGTKSKGGRISQWTTADSWSPNFAAEVKRLKVGQISEKPVKTEFGWHVVRVDAIR